MLKTNKTKALTIFPLAMLITVGIDSIRNLPSTALFGSELIFFLFLGAVFFLLPTAFVSAELSSTWTKDGGIFGWVNKAFGEKAAFLAIWLQWINTMVWYPTILSFIAGTAAFLISPSLAQNKYYLIGVILSTFWLLTIINLRGLNTSAKFASVCAVVGMIIPMLLIIVLAITWIFIGNPTQIHFTAQSILPSTSGSQSWISLTAIMASFLGLELATVHVKQVKDPQKTFPKAMLISVIIILLTMLFGALAIAIVLPQSQINLVDGVMQAFQNFFQAYHIAWLLPILAVMILVGSLGNMVNWIISPAKGLSQAAKAGFLPEAFCKENKNGVPVKILLTQAILVSFMCLAFLLMPSVNGSYWLLTALSTQLYMLMYIIMFISAIVLRYKFKDVARPFKIPGGKFGIWLTVLFGILGCTATLIVGFFPPSSINVGGRLHYEIVFSFGILVMILPILAFYFYRHRKGLLPEPELIAEA